MMVLFQLVEGFSTERASMETRRNLLKQIAKDNGITLDKAELSRNIDLQEKNEELKDRDGAAAVGDAFDSDNDGSSAMCRSEDEEIIENPSEYTEQKKGREPLLWEKLRQRFAKIKQPFFVLSAFAFMFIMISVFISCIVSNFLFIQVSTAFVFIFLLLKIFIQVVEIFCILASCN